MRNAMFKASLLLVAATSFGLLLIQPLVRESQGGGRSALDTPTITCVGTSQHTIFLQVCAGASGAPAGFTVQWTPLPDGTDCAAFVWPSDDTGVCKASFSGVPGCSIYNLGPNQCVTVEIGNLLDAECGVGLENCGADELACDTVYVFRAFAHNVPGAGAIGRSAFTANECCVTQDCESCVYTQGFWKTHGPEGCNPSGGDNLWPVDELTIGGATYSAAELCTNLQTPGSGNAVLILSHQLITAMMNRANGAGDSTLAECDDATVDELIDLGNELLDGLDINVDDVAPSSDLGQQMVGVAGCLDDYNNGFGGVDHCE